MRARLASLRDEASDRTNPLGRRLNPLIVDRPWTLVACFVLITLLMVGGIAGAFADQQAGAGQFEEDVEAFEALEAMEDNFDREERASGGTTAQLLVQDDRNVLSQSSLIRMAETQDQLESDHSLRIASTTSPATLVAESLDPSVSSPEDAVRVLESATSRQIASTIHAEADRLPVSADFTGTRATYAQVAVTYDTPPQADTGDYADLQFATVDRVDAVDGYTYGENVIVFGDAVFEDEIIQLLGDTAIIVFPAAIILILFFLLVAYRDPIDLGLGLIALLMTLIWTFGFMGFAGIAFSDSLITVFPLLLAVGIDFGIHIINRYREERMAGVDIGEAMRVTGDQLSTAFLIVTVTTVFALAANLTSPLQGLRDFGIVAAMGMVFTFLIFGVFLPAGKVGFDRLREGTRFPKFGVTPLGREGSRLGSALSVGARLARIAPLLVLVIGIGIGGVAAGYGTGIDVEFNEEVFFPEEERIEAYQSLPDPFAPSQYNFIQVLTILEEEFELPLIQEVTVYSEDRDIRSDLALQDIDRAIADPPDAYESSDRRADAGSILDAIDNEVAVNEEFAGTVRRYDSSGDGIPDREVDTVYDALFASGSGDQAAQYVTTDRGAMRIDFTPSVDATDAEIVAATEEVADNMALDAVPTGDYIVFQAVADGISESAINSLFVAFVLTAMFLVLTYWWFEGRAVYGVLNLVPVVISVALLAGSMRYFGVALSPFNAPIFGIAIGIGVDYTVHFMHRFVDEFEAGKSVEEAILLTTQGTGGALTGSMLTTVFGLGVLYVALIPLIVEYGLLLALGVFYAWLCAILLLPSAIVVWHRLATTSEGRIARYVPEPP